MSTATCKCGGTLTDDRWMKLDQIIERHRGKRGALIPILHEAQELFGCLSEDVQLRVAESLGISPAEIYGIATFYSFFTLQPRGKHKIAVCLGTACYVRGASEILSALKKELQVEVNGTTSDGKFSLEVVRCLGACGLAPVMMIGDNVYGRVKPDEVPNILKEFK